MKEVRINFLRLQNFKGCKLVNLDLRGQSATVYGSNGTGKTTIFDAFTWLLFGKDSLGRNDFEIKPLNSDGIVLDHGAVTEVSADLSVSGSVVSLRRTFFERWSKKRGSSEATYDGNTSEFYFDDVPVKKYEYENRVNELVGAGLFRVLTDVTYFCEDMVWKERRKMLMDVCGAPDDGEIMAYDSRFTALSNAIGGLTMDDFRAKLTAKRKGISGSRDTIPARLDEQKKMVDALSSIDFTAIEEERKSIATQIDNLSVELVQLKNGSLLDSKRNQVDKLRVQLNKLVSENQIYRAGQMPSNDIDELKEKINRARRDAARFRAMAQTEVGLIERIELDIEAYRDQWKKSDAESFEPVNCPTCGQLLNQSAQEEARRNFERTREQSKAEAVASAKRSKELLAAATNRMDQYNEFASSAEEEATSLKRKIDVYNLQKTPVVVDLPGFKEQESELSDGIRALEEEIACIEHETDTIRSEINLKISVLKSDLARLDEDMAKRSLLDFARKREDELRIEAKKKAEELEELDKLLFLCDDFTRFKVRFLEDSINQKFQLARFRLFEEQVNGFLADCCEATYNGVPFGSLNNGMRINVGVDVIRTISQHYGLRVPMFVDNAESVVELAYAGTQVIRLVVSAEDKELRCEYGA